MLSHDPVRTRLREALEHSEAGQFLRGARALWADAWSRGRIPTRTEIRALEKAGNTFGDTATDWKGLRLLGAGSLDGIRNCRFSGRVILRLDRGSLALNQSTIRDSMLGAATVHNVALLSRAIVDDGAVLRHVGEFSGAADSRYCLGLAVHPGDETGSRRVFLTDGLLLADCAAMAALAPAGQETLAHEWTARLRALCVSDHAFVGAGARIEHVRFLEDCFIGRGAVVRGAAALRRCILGSSGGDSTRSVQTGVHVGDNVIAEDCVLEAGARLESAAQVRRSLFLEQSGAEQGGHVADSVIGPNTVIAKGEVTASLLGPFVGFHHQALLIGTLWPEGRGNVGYGANVGSNHTGRKPDQELRPGEGTFFGLGCAIKFPADFSEAPHSLFATGVVTPPQKISFPFSLITTGTTAEETAAGRNEIIPAWMWSENAYALIRNAYKHADRNRARNHALPETAPSPDSPLAGTFLAADLFAPRIALHARRALAALDALSSQAPELITAPVLPGLGKNFARKSQLEKARASYKNYLAFVFFRELLWEKQPSAKLVEKAVTLAGESSIETRDADRALRLFRDLASSVELSLRRDSDRGATVFEDYATFHPDAEKDPVCKRLRADLTALAPVLKQRLGSP